MPPVNGGGKVGGLGNVREVNGRVLSLPRDKVKSGVDGR